MGDSESWPSEDTGVPGIYIVLPDDAVAHSADHIADSNDIGYHDWNHHLGNSPRYTSPLGSPASSFVSLAPSSTGSELDFSQPPVSDILHTQQSLRLLPFFDGLHLTNDTGLSDNGAIAYNDSIASNCSSTSSYGVPSPDLPSPGFSNASWVDGHHSSINSSPDVQHLGCLQSPTLPFMYPSSSDERLGNIGPNHSPSSPFSSPSSYHSASSSFDNPYSERGLPLGTNNSSGFHSSIENFFLPPSLRYSSTEQFPPQSSEPDYYSNFLLEPKMTLYPGLQSPAREYLSPLGSPSRPEFVQGSSSQVQHIDFFGERLGDLFEGQLQQDSISSILEAEQDDAQCDKVTDNTEDPKVVKLQISTPAGLAASELKRRNPHRWICTICNGGFTRKYSFAGKSHLFAHRGELTKRCDFCFKKLAGTLSRHKRSCKKNPLNRVDQNKSSKKR